MALVTQTQTILVDDVTDVVVTPIEQETDGEGLYVREIRIYGTPAVEGQTPPQEFVLRIKAVDRASLNLSVPASEM